jgi:mevalonate pyrophosphate decarboxylase
MDINTALLRALESKHSSEVAGGQAESGDVKTSAEELSALLRRISESSTREVEQLINQLQNLRKQLQNDGDRIQRDIAQYTELSQQTTQLTVIISDSVKKLPSSLLH